jgi:hypothetical protein
MASIKMGNIVVDMRGKISGNVYAKNKGGAYSRVKVKPANPKSTAQNTVRTNFTTHSKAWKGLTEAQRQSWLSGAASFPVKNRLGDSITLGGNALYVALNRNLGDVGVSPLSTCPAPATTASVAVTTATATNSTQAIVLTLTGAVPANTSLKLFMSPTVSAGVSNIGSKSRKITSYAPAAVAALAPTTAYLTKYGSIGAVGSKIFYEIVPVNNLTGQTGAPIIGVIVIA